MWRALLNWLDDLCVTPPVLNDQQAVANASAAYARTCADEQTGKPAVQRASESEGLEQKFYYLTTADGDSLQISTVGRSTRIVSDPSLDCVDFVTPPNVPDHMKSLFVAGVWLGYKTRGSITSGSAEKYRQEGREEIKIEFRKLFGLVGWAPEKGKSDAEKSKASGSQEGEPKADGTAWSSNVSANGCVGRWS